MQEHVSETELKLERWARVVHQLSIGDHRGDHCCVYCIYLPSINAVGMKPLVCNLAVSVCAFRLSYLQSVKMRKVALKGVAVQLACAFTQI